MNPTRTSLTPRFRTGGGERSWLGSFTVFLGLHGLAIVQPVVSAMADAPELFVFYGADRFDLLALVALGCILPPAITSLAVGLGTKLSPRVGSVLGASAGAAWGAAFGAQLARLVSIERPAGVAVAALAAGMVVGLGLARSRAVAEVCGLMAVFTLAVGAWFALSSAPARAAAGDRRSGTPIEATEATTPRPLVLLVLDEFPTSSLLGGDGELDRARIPNLARLADEGSWFSRHVTVGEKTTHVLPALLTGRQPSADAEDALWFDHEDNLFRLLASTHRLHVSEAITQICPPSLCPPVSRQRLGDPAPAWRRLLADGTRVARDQVWPWAEGQPIGLQRFADVEDGFPVFDVEAPVPMLDPITKFFGLDSTLQPERFEAWLAEVPAEVAAARDAGRPPALVFHLVLPHQPWVFRADGSRRSDVDRRALGYVDGRVEDAPAAVALAESHHLDQVAYTDRLVGSVLDVVADAGLYDEATIVVVGDHGISFVPGTPDRQVTPENAHHLLPTPLFVRSPAIEPGERDEPIQIVDLAGLIGEWAGVRVPWQHDGAPLGGRGDAAEVAAADGSTVAFSIRETTDAAREAARLRGSPSDALLRALGGPAQSLEVGDEVLWESNGPIPDTISVEAPPGASVGLVIADDCDADCANDVVAAGVATPSGWVVVEPPDALVGAESPATLRLASP